MPHQPSLRAARIELGRRVEHWLEVPMTILGALWLLLLIFELLDESTPTIDILTNTIWVVFVLEFVVRFILTPAKRRFLRRNWVTVVALAVPALRILRVARVVRVLRLGRMARGVRVARMLTSFSRGMRSLGATMHHRGFGYVVALTAIVLILGAAGMHAFERDTHDAFRTFGASLWWTAMLLTTMGSEFWPRTPEGRVVCLLLSVYAFAVFGYITATLASYFVDTDRTRDRDHDARQTHQASAG